MCYDFLVQCRKGVLGRGKMKDLVAGEIGGQYDLNRCSLAGGGADQDFSVHAMDNPLTHKKSKSGALADGTCRKEGFENPWEYVGCDSAAGIGDFDERGFVLDGFHADGDFVFWIVFGRKAFFGIGQKVGEDLK